MGAIEEFDGIVKGPLNKYLCLSKQIGGEVLQQALNVEKAFISQAEFLAMTLHTPKPSMEQMQNFLKPTSSIMELIHNHRQENRSSKYFFHLSSISESIGVLGWVVVTPDPSTYAKELHNAAAYYTNKVMIEFKDENTHVMWAKAWLDVLMALHMFIKENYRTGLTWNTQAKPGQVASKASGAPPPPPPPPAELFNMSQMKENVQEIDSRSALLRDINKGADITKCLKKVDKSGAITQKAPAPVKSPHKIDLSQKAPFKLQEPRLELDGRKWCVDFQVDKSDISVQATSMNQSVYIYRCANSTISITGKVNCITIDSCFKVNISFEDVVSSLELLSCEKMTIEPRGKLQTIVVDKSDSIMIYASEKCLDMAVISSKSSEMNIALPDGCDGYIEKPVPEQLKTVIVNNTLKTTAVEKM